MKGFLNVTGLSACGIPFVNICDSMLPSPPFGSNVTVYVVKSGTSGTDPERAALISETSQP